jgi:DNA repair protein RadA/Sms
VVPRTLCVVGEVGLAGELRAVTGLTRRVREAKRLGATEVIVPIEGELDDVAGVRVRRYGSLLEVVRTAHAGTG